MLEGTGEALAPVTPHAAFAFLVDPNNASVWFAGAGFDTPPTGAPRAGQTWSFARTPGTRRVQPVETTVFEPPSHFVWETQLPSVLTNFRWEVRCEPAGEGQPNRTCLRLTYRLRPGLAQWLTTAVGFSLVGRALHEQAQRAADRAAEALSSAGSSRPAARPRDDPRRGPSRTRS